MLKKINLSSLGKIFLFLFIVLPFLFQGNTQTFGQTATDEILPVGISCSLSATSPINPGEKTTLTWTIGSGGVTGGSMTPALPNFANFGQGGSAESGPLTQDTKFTLAVSGSGQANSCEAFVKVGNSSGDKLKFIKTLLNIPTMHNGGAQIMTSAILANNKFVFGGDCGVEMTGTRSGGGIWVVSEDGSIIKERQACIDAGSGTNMIYQHANVHQDELHAEGGGGFIRENSSWASCLQSGTAGPGDCKAFGDGANRGVYYGISGNPVSTSPLYTYNTNLIALKNRVISLSDGGRQGFATLISLPSWQVITTMETITGPSVGFGDLLVNRGILYSISKDGIMKEVKKLVPNPSTSIGSGSVVYSFDNSTKPAKLAVADIPKPGSSDKTKVYVYRLFGRGALLDKTIEMPNNVISLTDNPVNSFGIWGQYIVTKGAQSGEIDLWKNGEKIETVKMQAGGIAFDVVISKAGYVAVMVPRTELSNTGTTAAYLYQLTGLSSGGGTTTTPTNPTIPTDLNCGNASGSLADLCNQYKEILRKTCLVAPNIAICQNQ